MTRALILLCAVFFISCDKSEINSNLESTVDPALQAYFDSFEEEASARGIDIDLNALGLSGILTDIEDDNVAGSCRIGNNIHEIIIDNGIWSRANRWTKEIIIYHELGHCALQRTHENDKDDEGVCTSIMHESNLVCDLHYNANTKAEYLDELFTCCL